LLRPLNLPDHLEFPGLNEAEAEAEAGDRSADQSASTTTYDAAQQVRTKLANSDSDHRL
jgi:hypothetical protein